MTFQEVCTNLLQAGNLQPIVKKLLNHWRTKKITAKSIEPVWSQMVSDHQLQPLNNLAHEKDRMDYARYMMTGHIFGESDADYKFGNVTTFSLPHEFDSWRRDTENFYAALSLEDFEYKGSLMDSVRQKMVSGVETLMGLVQRKQVVCEFVIKELSVHSRSALEEIRKLDAAGIDWSNIPDYLTREDFFSMVKACSGTDTRHSLHFMNWVTRVFGASLIDYPNKSSVYADIKKRLDRLYHSVKRDRPYLRQDKYLQYFMNGADTFLGRKFRQKFTYYYFNGRKVAVQGPFGDEFNPFSRANSSFSVSFKRAATECWNLE